MVKFLEKYVTDQNIPKNTYLSNIYFKRDNLNNFVNIKEILFSNQKFSCKRIPNPEGFTGKFKEEISLILCKLLFCFVFQKIEEEIIIPDYFIRII